MRINPSIRPSIRVQEDHSIPPRSDLTFVRKTIKMPGKTAAALIKKLTQKKQKQKKEKEPVIFILPNELLFMVASFLPLDSQACLALTCKTFLGVFSSVLRDKELRFPRAFYDEPKHRSLSTATNARNRLLYRLQDKRWVYCAMCMMLHPACEFNWRQRARRAKKRCCMRWGGIVDICPCINLTFRGKLRLMKRLQEMEMSKEGNGTGYVKDKSDMGPWKFSVDKQGRPYLRHECSITDHPWARVSILVNPAVRAGRLLILSRYTIRTRPIAMPKHMAPLVCCPHRNLLFYTGLQSRLPSCHQDRDCARCQTSLEAYRTGDVNLFIIKAIRNLGGEEPVTSDQVWQSQCEPVYFGLNRRSWRENR